MKISKSKLKQIIKEELSTAYTSKLLHEAGHDAEHHDPEMAAAIMADCSGLEEYEEICKKQAYYEAWKSKLPKDENGDSVFPKNTFKNLREKWARAYSGHGINKKVWIKKLIKEYIRTERTGSYGEHNKQAKRLAYAYYNDHIKPLVMKAIWSTKVYAHWESFYIETSGGWHPSVHGQKLKPGIYINGTRSEADLYHTFHHEMGHAVDDALGARDIGKFKQLALQLIQKTQELAHGSRGRPQKRAFEDEAWEKRPSATQLGLIKKIMPDTDNYKAIKIARKLRAQAAERDDGYTEFLMDPHGFNSWEIYSNIIDNRVRMGALFTCADVKRLRDPKLIINYVDNARGEQVITSKEGDLAGALQRAALFTKMDDCFVADVLNQIAALGPPGKPRGRLKPGETKQDRAAKIRPGRGHA